MQAPFPLFGALNVPYRIIELLHTNRHRELLSACWDEDFLLTEYDVSQYLSRIEGSPPKRNAAGSIPVWDVWKKSPEA